MRVAGLRHLERAELVVVVRGWGLIRGALLLHGVRDLVRDELLSGGRLRVVLAGAEVDRLADGERARVERLGGLGRLAAGVDLDAGEIGVEAALEAPAQLGRQRGAAPATPRHLIGHARALAGRERRATDGVAIDARAAAGGARLLHSITVPGSDGSIAHSNASNSAVESR